MAGLPEPPPRLSPVSLVAVVADGAGGTAVNAFLARNNFLWSCWLTIDVGMASLVIATDVVWCLCPAKVAIGALDGDVILAGDILRIAFFKVGHNRPFTVSGQGLPAGVRTIRVCSSTPKRARSKTDVLR